MINEMEFWGGKYIFVMNFLKTWKKNKYDTVMLNE